MATSSRTTKTTGKKSTGSRKASTTRKKKQAKNDFRIIDEVILWVVLALALIILIGNFGMGGVLGNTISSFFFGTFGFCAYLLPFLLFFTIAFIIVNIKNKTAMVKTLSSFILYLCVCGLFELMINGYDKSRPLLDYYIDSASHKSAGGIIGGLFCKALCPAVGLIGAYVFLLVVIAICIVLITKRSLFAGVQRGSKKVYQTAKKDVEYHRERAALHRERMELQRKERLARERELLEERAKNIDFTIPKAEPVNFHQETIDEVMPEIKMPTLHIQGLEEEPVAEKITAPKREPQVVVEPEEEPRVVPEEPKVVKNPKSTKKEQETAIQNVAEEIALNEVTAIPKYDFPPLRLLKKGAGKRGGDSAKYLRETAEKLQNTLHSFGVEVNVTDVSCGPAVTRYELTPEQGVKVSRIVNLADDIKLNLAAADIRIEAPIPGKAAVGIEVPNHENSAVMLRDLLESPEFQGHPSKLAFAAGKDISGKIVVTDIARMPHLLIAGATGSGKSVCINTIIMSILYKARPDEVKLIMIDPKVVELSVYNGIPHLFIPVVTDPKKAAGALNWAVAEMTDRYQKFADLNVRDLKGYNERVASVEDIEGENKPEKLPQIVIIVDELADLMMVAPGEVEDAICRLAQLARAAGIHLIIATQRPSVNVITGLIKANMPSRIAFAVSSGVDSRTIIDMNGAEKLLGKGDMLFYPQGYQKPARVQCAFVSDTEVAEVVDYLSMKCDTPVYNEEIQEKININQTIGTDSSANERDVLFGDAGKFIIEKDKASIGMLQRVFKIGFNRAARIMDQLSESGVVGPEEGTKPRKVLMSMEEFEQYLEEYV